MIVIAEPYARYSNTLPASELDRAVANLLNFADEITRSHFADRDQRFEVTVAARVEIGSTRTWITIAALVHALIFYGDIRQSVDYLIKDGQHLGRLILAGVPGAIGLHPYSAEREGVGSGSPDRKSTRLNSSHLGISYAVFCLKKEKKTQILMILQTKKKSTQTKKKTTSTQTNVSSNTQIHN